MAGAIERRHQVGQQQQQQDDQEQDADDAQMESFWFGCLGSTSPEEATW
jgi:hypothetical protein